MKQIIAVNIAVIITAAIIPGKTVPEEISTGTFDGSGGDGDLPF